MEGVLWTRDGRSKLLRGWQKRYYVLSKTGVLREYASTMKKKELLRRASSPSSSSLHTSHAIHGMTLQREMDVRGAMVKTLPFPTVGKHHAFQVTIGSAEATSKVVLCARQAEDMRVWMTALCASALHDMVPRPPSPINWGRESELSLDRALESEFLDVSRPQRTDMAQLSSVYEWLHDTCVKTSQNLTVAGVYIPRGSFLVSANGVFLQTLSSTEVKKLLLESTKTLPVSLRFLRSPAKCGVLRTRLDASPLTQLKALAKYRRASRRDWKEQVVDLSGDLLTCQGKTRPALAMESSRPNRPGLHTKPKRVVTLSSQSWVKPVHEFVCDRKFCFVVTARSQSMLFQARSETDRRAWTDAIQRAITIAEGLVPGGALARGSFDLEALQRQSSLNMRHLEQAFQGMEKEGESVFFDEEHEEGDASPVEKTRPSLLSRTERGDATLFATSLPEMDLMHMLKELQSAGRFVEALQLMQQNTTWRSTYWHEIFAWALAPAHSDEEMQTRFQHLLQTPLSEKDEAQVQKDIPRTIKWLAGSAGAPQLKETERAGRLEDLDHVLHAFLSSCSLDVRTDDDAVASEGAGAALSPGFYMQGMNGLAFILLEVLENDQVNAFRFLRGLVARILPHVFGLCCDGMGHDHFDLFQSLVQVGDVLQEVARLHVPHFHAAVERAGLPVCLLAYKWFPTLFSDVTLTASQSQLRFDTLLCCWDVCLLQGLEGMFCVALALCSAAEEDVVALSAGGDTACTSAEQVSATVGRSLALLTPHDLITNVCEVLDSCSHPVLLKLRNAHRRRLKLGYASVEEAFHGFRAPLDGSGAKEAGGVSPPMTVTDLDSGKVFQISKSGNIVLPTENSKNR